MKNLLLKVRPLSTFDKVAYLSIDLASVKLGKDHYDNKEFDVRFNVELLDKEEVVLDYGYGFSSVDLDNLKRDKDNYILDIYLKGLDTDHYKSKHISVELTEDEKEVVNVFFNAKDKIHEKLLMLKSKARSLLGKTKEEQDKFIDGFKSSVEGIHKSLKQHTSDCCDCAKDFVDRAKTNNLSKKEKVISGVAIGLTALAFLAGRGTKK